MNSSLLFDSVKSFLIPKNSSENIEIIFFAKNISLLNFISFNLYNDAIVNVSINGKYFLVYNLIYF